MFSNGVCVSVISSVFESKRSVVVGATVVDVVVLVVVLSVVDMVEATIVVDVFSVLISGNDILVGINIC